MPKLPPARLLLLCLLPGACAAPELVPGARPGIPAAELSAVAGLGSADSEERAEAEADLAKEPLERRVALLRAGLWLLDATAAAACARHLDPTWLDAGETARAAHLLQALAHDPAQAQALLAVLGSREIPEVLARKPAAELVARIGPLLRPEHLPALLALCTDPGARCAAAQERLVHDILPVSDRQREAVTAALLRQDVPPATTGLPAALRQILVAWARDDRDPVLDSAEVSAWWLRWLLASTPAADDVLTLCNAAIACLRRDDQRALAVVVRACGFLQDNATAELLQRLARQEGQAPAVRAAVLAAQIRRGEASATRRDDAKAARALEQLADTDGHALLMWFDAVPERAAAAFTQALLSNSPRTYATALHTWTALRAAEPAAGLFAPESWQADLATRALVTAHLDGLRLARLGAEFPGCRTRKVALAGVRALAHRLPADADILAVPPGALAHAAAFLELGAGEEFRRVLRDLANTTAPGPRRTWARICLLRLADAASAVAMPGWLDADLVQECPDARNALALVRAPALDAFLRPPAGENGPALIAWALRCGLPPALAGQLLDETPVRDEVLAAFHAGRPVEGLVRFLAFSPDALLTGVGAVRDARVTTWLQRFTTQRELGRYTWAARELARQGDRAARVDLARGLQDGRPAWFQQGLLDVSVRRAWSFWLEELESNRERAALIQQWLGLALGMPTSLSPLTTPRARWGRLSGEFTWSPLTQCYVPTLSADR